ncbi:hypothetical protein [Chitinophaga sp. sic0106]|uniref:hypothetical protein n=1 Tax=Chitinophaga sp. sic0106 TaxID=2854785 RepID=UPI001C43B0D9|nr:hypothetical protein [Chitinophaga sp. sic0106]MBV7532878.1 hypothetical protein [Chitinophaga sp. sic0106]
MQWHQADNFITGWLKRNAPAIPGFGRILLYGWIILHLLFISVVNSVSVYDSYQDFHKQPRSAVWAHKLESWLSKPALQRYGRYTGAETGYGFFGINVRSNGMLIGECNGEAITPEFRSFETTLRFFSMGNSLTDEFIKPGEHTEMLNDYNQLVMKNIAVTLFRRRHCMDTAIYISYNMLDFPMLQQVRGGTMPAYSQVKLISINYSLNVYEQLSRH